MYQPNLHASDATCRLLIVDDHVLHCEGLASLFAEVAGVDAVFPAAGPEEAICSATQFRPHVALVDMNLPVLRAFETVKSLLRRVNSVRVVFLDDTLDRFHLKHVLRLGAWGYWTKRDRFAALAEGVLRVAAGRRSFCPAAEPHLVKSARGRLRIDPPLADGLLERLTAREVEVLAHLSAGYSVKQCAQRMAIAANTVDNHKARLMRKLDLHKAAELARFAVRQGLLD